MSKLDELINELCPNGVEYKTIDDIAFKDLYANHTVIRRLGQTPVAAFQ